MTTPPSRAEGRGVTTRTLGDEGTRLALAALELEFVASVSVASEAAATAAADALNGPAVIKLLSDQVVHKSELGLVRLGVPPERVGDEYRALVKKSEELRISDARFVLQPQDSAGLDLYVGCKRDPVFGPVIILGLGGVTVELFGDVVRGLAPLAHRDVRRMLSMLKSYPLLQGFRGSSAYPTTHFEDLVARISDFASKDASLDELDLNPVRIHGDGRYLILDARSTWLSAPAAAPAPTRALIQRGLDALFWPASVAVVGASRASTRPGGRLFATLVAGGFEGPIYPVNRSGGELLGRTAFRGLAELPQVPDLVCIALAADAALDAVRECAALGVPVVLLLASGYSEIGPGGGEKEEELRRAIAVSSTRVCGPNTIGVVNPDHRLYATFSQGMASLPDHGNGIAVIAQSGAVVGSLVGRELAAGYGMGAWVTVGNQLDLDVADYIEYFAGQPATCAIALFLEGVTDGARLRSAFGLARASGVPVAAFKTGLTCEGGAAVSAHSGALAGAADVYETVLESEGVAHVRELSALLETAWTLGHARRPVSNRVSVVTTSGGAGSATVDLVVTNGLQLQDVPDGTAQLLSRVLPELAKVANPLDVTAEGAFTPGLLRDVVAHLGAVPGTGITMVVLTSIVGDEAVRVAGEIAAAADRSDTPVLVTWLVDRSLAIQGMQLLAARGVRLFDDPARMVAAAGHLVAAAQLNGESE